MSTRATTFDVKISQAKHMGAQSLDTHKPCHIGNRVWVSGTTANGGALRPGELDLIHARKPKSACRINREGETLVSQGHVGNPGIP